MNAAEWPLVLLLTLFVAAAAAIALFGVYLTRAARDLAHRTRLGEAITGAIFLGVVSSLPGITTSVTAAWSGHAELAVSNALGGIAAQTAFLALADILYRKANLEHAAASVENLMLCTFLLVLLAIHLIGLAVPGPAIFGVHPLSLLLILVYVLGYALMLGVHEKPMWQPTQTPATTPESEEAGLGMGTGMPVLWLIFGGCAAVVTAAGWLLAHVAVPIADATGLSQSFVGGALTAIATSLPELIIVVTAVRLGALSLAMGDIVGGNAFDTLFVSVSDFAYRQGSIYAAVSWGESFWLALTVLMTSVLLTGMLYRERRGIGNIGFESAAIIVIYLSGAVTVAVMR